MNIPSLNQILLFLLFAATATGYAQTSEKCLTQVKFEEAMKQYPGLQKEQESFNRFAATEEARTTGSAHRQSSTTVKRIIPVVVHVIHQGGPENISRKQIEDQIRILNEDYARLNKDTSLTPAHFDSIAASMDVEFRLAKKDPKGNCTEGITRTYSALTNNADGNTQRLIQWDPYKYLNIWVVKSIGVATSTGFTLGYAQYPSQLGFSPQTDGFVVRADYFGSIGLASSQLGRTATHEIGHYLGLAHVWGDTQCGDDNVSDTPPQFGPNQSNCPSYPKLSNCSLNGKPTNAPYGDMYMNYMDYVVDQCMNSFSKGQKARADASFTTYRYELFSDSNLVRTGVQDTSYHPACAPIAEFVSDKIYACVNDTITLSDQSYNGTATSRTWTLPGGVQTSVSNPKIAFSKPGLYDITLRVYGGTDSSVVMKRNYIAVFKDSSYKSPFSDSYETELGWTNQKTQDTTVKWQRVNTAAYSGSSSYRINLFNSGSAQKSYLNNLISPSLDVSAESVAKVHFKVAYAVRNSSATSTMSVYTSSNCGATWTLRKTFSSAELKTVTANTLSSFTPSSPQQWKELTVTLFSRSTNLLIRFEVLNGTNGNNLFIDDININSLVTEITPLEARTSLGVYPNPSSGSASVSFQLAGSSNVRVRLFDMLGKEAWASGLQVLGKGVHSLALPADLERGAYVLRFELDEEAGYIKLIRQ